MREGRHATTVTGYRPSCTCAASLSPVPGILLDLFAGAATTGLVGRALGRTVLLNEASAFYLRLSRERLGLADLDRWEGHSSAVATPTSYNDLPLFAP
jgi:hypothetical protein